jgi:3-oxoacyl-[acyl-carrier protein] reductase
LRLHQTDRSHTHPERFVKSVLVSGASRGIGKAIAQEPARRGHNVAVGFRDRADAVQSVAEEMQHAGGSA